jgi:hypothetical protein
MEGGKLVKETGGNMTDGSVKLCQISTLQEFSRFIATLKPDQAICYGVPKNMTVGEIKRVLSERLVASDRNAISRTNAHFNWAPDNAGIVMIDYDPAKGEPPITKEELVAVVRKTVAELRDVEMLWLLSSSSHLFNTETGEDLTGLRGQRLYLIIDNATEIPRIVEILFKRLWLDGHGRIEIGKAGQLLVRATIDGSVYQPSRLDFASGAYCEPPLEQRRGEGQIISGNLKILDSKTIRNLSAAEERRYETLVASKKNVLKPEAARVRKVRIDEKVSEHPPEEQEEARIRYTRAYEDGELQGDFKITVFAGSERLELTVNDILNNCVEYDKCRTLDPVEPDYNDWDDVGILNLKDEHPNLYSFAHGGRCFRLIKHEVGLQTVDLTDYRGYDPRLLLGKYVLPEEYFLEGGGIKRTVTVKQNEKTTDVIIHEIAVTKHLRSLRSGKVLVEVTFRAHNGLTSVIMPREAIADNDVISLASNGAHVNVVNAKEVIRFLMAMEAINMHLIPQVAVFEQLGWIRVAEDELFIIGGNYVKGGSVKPIAQAASEAFPFELHFADPETARSIDAIEMSGTLSGWVEAARKLNPYPYVKIAVIAACVSPLLEKFRLPGFVIHYGYLTSAGKSTTLKIAGSVYGDPERVYLSWSATKTAIERRSSTYNNLAILVDETKTITARDKPGFIREIVYQHSGGISKGRGTTRGLQQTLHWRSVMISTGEASLLSVIGDGGAKARVLDLPGIPFGKKDKETADLVDSVLPLFKDNYGHALPHVLAHLMGRPDEMQKFISRYAQMNEDIRSQLPPGIGSRLSAIIAFILTGGEILNTALDLGWEMEDVKNAMLEPCIKLATQDTEGQQALEFIYEFAISHKGGDAKPGRALSDGETIPAFITHMGSECGIIGSSHLAITHSYAKALLRQEGYEPDAVFKEWRENGWLDIGKGRQFEKQVSMNGGKPWCIFLNGKALKTLSHCDYEDSAEIFF